MHHVALSGDEMCRHKRFAGGICKPLIRSREHFIVISWGRERETSFITQNKPQQGQHSTIHLYTLLHNLVNFLQWK